MEKFDFTQQEKKAIREAYCSRTPRLARFDYATEDMLRKLTNRRNLGDASAIFSLGVCSMLDDLILKRIVNNVSFSATQNMETISFNVVLASLSAVLDIFKTDNIDENETLKIVTSYFESGKYVGMVIRASEEFGKQLYVETGREGGSGGCRMNFPKRQQVINEIMNLDSVKTALSYIKNL